MARLLSNDSLEDSIGTITNRRRLLNINLQKEASKLKEEATKKLNDIEQLCNGLEDLGNTYEVHLQSCGISVDISEQVASLESNKNKLKRNNLYFCVCGGTSAGKSTLVNALLGKNLLPSSANRCTPCCIVIQSTEEQQSFFKVDNEGENYDIDELNEMADVLQADRDTDTNQIAYRTLNVYVSKTEEHYYFLDLRHAQISLMDTPGYDQPAFRINEQIIKGSDVFVFVVDGVIGFNEEIKEFFQCVFRDYSLKDFLVVFNKWDLVYQDGHERVPRVEQSYINEAITFFSELGLGNDIENHIFFLSSVHIKLLRHCDRHTKVRKRLKDLIEAAGGNKDNVFVCGGIGTGRSTVINMLLDKDLMPTDASGTPSFVSFERQDSDQPSSVDVENEAGETRSRRSLTTDVLNELGNDRSGRKYAISVNLDREFLRNNPECILSTHDVKLYDTPHSASVGYVEDAERLMKDDNLIIIIVVSARRAYQENKQTIVNTLKPLRNANMRNRRFTIVLIVNKWDYILENNKDQNDQRAQFRKMFVEGCIDYQSEALCNKRIFFTSLKDYKISVKSDKAFEAFTEKLFMTGTDNFKQTKFEPIFEALETCSSNSLAKAVKLLEDISTQLKHLEEVKDIIFQFNASPDENPSRSNGYLMMKAKSPVTLFMNYERNNLNLPDSLGDLDELIRAFSEYCDTYHIHNEKNEIRHNLLRFCESDPQRQCLKRLYRNYDDQPRRSSNNRISMNEDRLRDILPAASLLKRLSIGWETLDKRVLSNSVAICTSFGGLLTSAMIQPNTASKKRILLSGAGIAVGFLTALGINVLIHFLKPTSRRRRRKALEQYLCERYCDWHRNLLAKTKLEVLEYHTILYQSFEQAISHLKHHITRYERKNFQSREERGMLGP